MFGAFDKVAWRVDHDGVHDLIRVKASEGGTGCCATRTHVFQLPKFCLNNRNKILLDRLFPPPPPPPIRFGYRDSKPLEYLRQSHGIEPLPMFPRNWNTPQTPVSMSHRACPVNSETPKKKAEHSAVRNSSFDLSQVTTGFHPGTRLPRFFPASTRGKLHPACCCTCRKIMGGEILSFLLSNCVLYCLQKTPKNQTTPRT